MTKYAVIIIDDEPLIVSSVKGQLRKHFGSTLDIESALSAQEGLEVIESITGSALEVPLVICDYLMPGIKGDSLIVELHKNYPKTSSILLTGQVDVEAMGNIINHAKLFRYMAKPWDEMDLILTVREAINSYDLSSLVTQQNKQIVDYAFSNAHNVRGPLATILGLIGIMKAEPNMIQEAKLVEKLEKSANDLDQVVRSITVTLAESNK